MACYDPLIQTLPFCVFVTRCRFCEDCFIIFVYHLLHSIWYLVRVSSSILSDISKFQPVRRIFLLLLLYFCFPNVLENCIAVL